MKATVRSITSPDVDLESFVPVDPADVSVFIQVIAGPVDGPGDESFDLDVVTPGWLTRRVAEQGPTIGRHYLIVERWQWKEVEHFIVTAFEREEASSWKELASRLGRLGRWEFEDYQPVSELDGAFLTP